MSDTAATRAPAPTQTPRPTADPASFRAAVGRFPTGVCVVTTPGPNGPSGLTTNAVSSLSLDPLLLLVCIDRTSRTLPAIQASGVFAVNVLADDQRELASVFASKRLAAEKFAATSHVQEHGVPVLDGVASWIACSVHEWISGGDHAIAVGAVLGTFTDPERRALVFADGEYAALAR